MPNPPDSHQQKTHYDRKSSLFTVAYKQTHPFYRDHLLQIANLIMSLSSPADKILEVGCGEALDSNFIDRPNLIVSDISLNRCASKHPRELLDLSRPAHLRRIKRKYGRFDLIYEVSTLHHVPDMDQALKHLKLLGDTILLIEPIIWNPHTLALSLINIKNEPHYFEMKQSSLEPLLNRHFKEVNHQAIYGRFHYLCSLLPPSLARLAKPFYSLTTLPKYNVYTCRD